MAKKRGPGQPPKGEDKRKNIGVYLSPPEREKVEAARDIEDPDRRVGAYVRDVVIDHADKVIKKSARK